VLSLSEHNTGATTASVSHDPAQNVEPRSSSTHTRRFRPTVEEVEDEDMPPSTPPHASGREGSMGDTPRSTPMAENAGTDSNRIPNNEEPLDRPSEYLRKRCPLCFGGEQIHDPNMMYVFKYIRLVQALLTANSADNVVCLDACFTQKRRHGPEDPYHQHPQSVFLTDKEVKAMEDLVAKQRHQPSSRTADSNEDGFEPTMKVPISVLNDCGESFKAADERRVKASTQFFSDTGVMALLCRHDRVLWLVNMTSPGERQHYALALLNKLFAHLPPSIRVGLLYDIGCQLHRSCVKWGFLSDFLDRITFGISVFHAYGHQWPCQLIYHPRKCVGFGLTDGEGCERFWSSIKQLIPSLRVSGVSYKTSLIFSLLIDQ
jgi:hypothetical protein